jgi:exopolyphosphatase/guanosine-5'-triphosphate,3'-diphosphate pyrophosphatase
MARLAPEEQRRVQRLAAILRLAGGLDRSRTQTVRDVTVRIDDGRAVFDVVAEQSPQADLWGAERRADLFEKVFGLPATIAWAGAAAERAAG